MADSVPETLIFNCGHQAHRTELYCPRCANEEIAQLRALAKACANLGSSTEGKGEMTDPITTIRFLAPAAGAVRFGIPWPDRSLPPWLQLSAGGANVQAARVNVLARRPNGNPSWVGLVLDFSGRKIQGDWDLECSEIPDSEATMKSPSWLLAVVTDPLAYQTAGLPFRFGDPGEWVTPSVEKLTEDMDDFSPNDGDWLVPLKQQGLSYLTRLYQEYDPAMLLWREGVLRGNLDYLHVAYEAAQGYLENCSTEYGGCFQHRAPLNSLIAQVAALIADRLNFQANELDMELARRLTGDKAAKAAAASVEEDRGRGPIDLDLQITRCAVERVLRDYLMSQAANMEKSDHEIQPSDVARVLLDHPLARKADIGIVVLGLIDWAEVDHSADPVARHEGGHCLAESLVAAYLMTGDPTFRARAVAIAQDHVGVIIPREIREIRAARAGYRTLRLRALGWPLLNISAVATLLEGSPDEKEKELQLLQLIRSAQTEIIGFVRGIDFSQIEGSIHAGVMMRALLAASEQMPVARDWALNLAEYWSVAQYVPGKGAPYKTGDRSTADVGYAGLCLAGFAAAGVSAHKDALKLLQAAKPADSAKVIAMRLGQVHQAVFLVEKQSLEKSGTWPVVSSPPPKTITAPETAIVSIPILEFTASKLEIEKMRDALKEIETLVGELPGGIDKDAKPNDRKPEDQAAHIGGIIWQICQRGLGKKP